MEINTNPGSLLIWLGAGIFFVIHGRWLRSPEQVEYWRSTGMSDRGIKVMSWMSIGTGIVTLLLLGLSLLGLLLGVVEPMGNDVLPKSGFTDG